MIRAIGLYGEFKRKEGADCVHKGLAFLWMDGRLYEDIVKTLCLPRESVLQIAESVDICFREDGVASINAGGRGQPYGIEVLLLYFALNGYEGDLCVTGDYFEKLKISEGKLFSSCRKELSKPLDIQNLISSGLDDAEKEVLLKDIKLRPSFLTQSF